MTSAPLGMLCLKSRFSLLARLLLRNGHRLEMTVTMLRHMGDRERYAGRLYESGGCKKIMEKKEQQIRN